MLPLPCDLQKAVVAPDDISALRPEDQHGQRRIGHGILGGQLHISRHVIQIFLDRFLPALASALMIQPQQDHHHQFSRPQIGTERAGSQSKQHQKQEI